ncbi:hypothetical protein UPYG_G00105000 [Umbra pygmaea]|uniref:Uncharacterized protein n=1 Tax=Umbra pygmaea TaxID=75934 RepID=A0ABD0X224_UMBPY
MRVLRFFTIMNCRIHVLILAFHLAMLTEHGLSDIEGCSQGYEKVNKKCIDEDECEEEGICGENAKCFNAIGSYTCMCDNGFITLSGSMNYTADEGLECKDINECHQNICGPKAKCVNSIGSYNCKCPVGFKTPIGGDWLHRNETCEDEDECEEEGICGENAKCFNAIGSYTCMCDNGFITLSGSVNYTADEGLECKDKDECLEDCEICGKNTKCVNIGGSYFCTCNNGFKSLQGSVNFKNDTCNDINECFDNKNICGPNAKCENTIGSYSCICIDGFFSPTGENRKGQNGTCEDIDECALDYTLCGVNAMCKNTQGIYVCECNPGFVLKSGKMNYTENEEQCEDFTCDVINSSSQTLPKLKGALSEIQNICLNSKKRVMPLVSIGPDGDALLESLLLAIDDLLSGGPLNNAQVSALLKVVELSLRIIGPLMEHPETSKSNNHTVLELLVQRNASSPQGPVSLSCSQAQLDCHWETAAGQDSYPGFATVALLTYKGLETSCNHSFTGLEAQKGQSFQMNSKVVTATVSNKNTSLLKDSVNFTFSHLKEADKGNHTCVYWDSETTDGAWSKRGCFLVQSNATHTVCSCKHLSSFAVLLALYDMKETYQLQLITWVGLSLSQLCLFLCILTFSLIRAIRSTRNTIHLNLCISLFIANLVFLVGISRTENKSGCAVIAGILHFFYLAALCWMCLEGVHLFRMVVLVFNTTIRPLYLMLGGYGVPAVIVAISAIYNAQGYGTERHCWLTLEDGFIWSFFGPVSVIIVVSVFFFLVTVWKLAQKFSSLNPDLSKLHKIKLFTITAVAQLCVLGSTWIFGCFQFNDSTLPMSYLFTIFNCLQGFLLYVMHCLLSKQVREEYGKIVDSVCAPQKLYSQFTSNQSSSSKSQNSKSVQNTNESQL